MMTPGVEREGREEHWADGMKDMFEIDVCVVIIRNDELERMMMTCRNAHRHIRMWSKE